MKYVAEESTRKKWDLINRGEDHIRVHLQTTANDNCHQLFRQEPVAAFTQN